MIQKKNKTVFVTGSAGFIGGNVFRYFSLKGWKVYGIARNVSLKSLNNLKNRPDLIIHCAGSPTVGFSFENPEQDFQKNVVSLLPVLEFLRLKSPSTRLVYISSVAVYGEHTKKPIKETDNLNPISPYGTNKKIAEELLESFSKNYKLKISIIRFSSVYGPGLKKQLLWEACEKIRKWKKEIEFFGTGKEVRDFLFISDVLTLIEKVTRSKNIFEIINGGSGKGFTIKEVLTILFDVYGSKAKIKFNGKTLPGSPKYVTQDISRAKKTGWSPKTNLKQGLTRFVEGYNNHKSK